MTKYFFLLKPNKTINQSKTACFWSGEGGSPCVCQSRAAMLLAVASRGYAILSTTTAQQCALTMPLFQIRLKTT